ncbi:hypothetical protein B0O99DRAFT_400489 [Bisporella sp. PMI_857]|nr:hypothetical protein B0O99DRAFT_400489 [Bisporella sp. PMI_857]
MPHVASQLCLRDSVSTDSVLRRTYECHDFDRPEMYQRRKISNSAHEVPSLSLLVSMPDVKHWDFGSIRHIQDLSASPGPTPGTAVDSVFELPSAYPAESPNSSINSPNSLFSSPTSFSPNSSIASVKSSKDETPAVELEDTSAIASARRPFSISAVKPAVAEPSYVNELRRPEFSLRAAAAIENIIAIEADNRLLLERAIAAEEATQILRQRTESLQHRIDYCAHIHRPQTAPEKKAKYSPPTPAISSFNRTSLQKAAPQTPPLLQIGPLLQSTPPTTPTPTGRRRPIPKPLQLSQGLDLLEDPFLITYGNGAKIPSTSPIPLTQTRNNRRRPSPLALSEPLRSPPVSSSKASSPFATINFSAPPHPSRRPMRTTKSHSRLTTQSLTSPPSSSKFPSVTRPSTNYTFFPPPARNASSAYPHIRPSPRLESSKSSSALPTKITIRDGREKAVPPIGPMSPSAIPGKVEIGAGINRWERERERFMEAEAERGRYRGLRGFWRWRKGEREA